MIKSLPPSVPKLEMVAASQLSPVPPTVADDDSINPIDEPSLPLYILSAAYNVKSLPFLVTITLHHSPS